MNPAVAFGDTNLSWALPYGVAAGMLAVGVVMVLWGWMMHRAALVLLGCGAGYLLGDPLARSFDWPMLVTQGSLAVVLAILLACLARMIWALLLAAIVACLVGGVVLNWRCPDVVEKAGQPPEFHEIQELDEACEASQKYCRSLLKALWKDRPVLLIGAAGVAALVGLVIGLVLTRFTRIFLTDLIGASLAVSGVLLVLVTAKADLRDWVQRHWYVPALVLAVLAIVGMIVQYRSALEADREERSEEASPVDKRKKPKGDDEAKQ